MEFRRNHNTSLRLGIRKLLQDEFHLRRLPLLHGGNLLPYLSHGQAFQCKPKQGLQVPFLNKQMSQQHTVDQNWHKTNTFLI